MNETKPIRVWQNLDVQEVKKHCITIDDLYGMCLACHHPGINFVKDNVCPNCKTSFKYVTTKLKKIEEVIKIANRIKKENLSLILIDKEDLERGDAKDQLTDLFKKN